MLNSTVNAVRLQAEPSKGALLLLLSNSQTSISLGGETSHFPTGPLHHQQVSELGQYQGTGHFRQNKVFPENVLLEMSIQCNCNSSMTCIVLPCSLPRLQRVESLHPSSSLHALSLQPATSLWTTTSHFLKCIFLQNGFQSTYISLLSTVSGERHRK